MYLGQKGGSLFIVLIALAAIGATFSYVKQSIDSRERNLNRMFAREQYELLRGEINDIINARGNCGLSLVDEKFSKNLPTQELAPGDTDPKIHRFSVFRQDISGSKMSRPFIDPKGASEAKGRYSSLKVVDAQLIAKAPIPNPAPEFIEAQLVLLISESYKGRPQGGLPSIKKDVILQVKNSGPNLKIESCAPSKIPEFEAPNIIMDDFSVKGNGEEQIVGQGGETHFKICAISGYDNEPDKNSVKSEFMQGDIATQTPMLCELYPVSSSGNPIKPDEVLEPKEWYFKIRGEETTMTMGISKTFKSYVWCEAVCF